MLFLFKKTNNKDNGVDVDFELHEVKQSATLGKLKFPTKLIWAKFLTSLQNGATSIADLAIQVETNDNSNDKTKEK